MIKMKWFFEVEKDDFQNLVLPGIFGSQRANFHGCPRKAGMLALWAAFFSLLFLAGGVAHAQTASTGSITGTVTDASGGVIPGVHIQAISEATGETREATVQAQGTYVVPLLPPGTYHVEATKSGFAPATQNGVAVVVTEVTKLDIRMTVQGVAQKVTVEATAPLAQTQSAALGRVTDERTINNLPLVTRNYTQIIGLSPGVSQDVTNAAELGRGNGGTIFGSSSSSPFEPAGFNVDGARFTDNNFQMNGVPINDVAAFGTLSGVSLSPTRTLFRNLRCKQGSMTRRMAAMAEPMLIW